MVPEVRALQVAPPLAVATMTPLSPTAQPREASLKATALRAVVVPEACVPQVAPPLAVTRIVPLLPTA